MALVTEVARLVSLISSFSDTRRVFLSHCTSASARRPSFAMLSIQNSSKHDTEYTPNLLPCRIQYNGPVNATDRYWRPEEEVDGTQTVHFRGRRLRGRKVRLPDGYTGAVLTRTDMILPPSNADDADDVDEDKPPEVGVMKKVGQFNAVVILGHDAVPEETEDPYSKAINEWIPVAKAIHSTSRQEETAERPKES